jgi:hypothetical protein
LKDALVLQHVRRDNLVSRKAELVERLKHAADLISRSPVKRGAPWNATAYPPTIRNSTPFALNKEQSSAKSFWSSIRHRSTQGCLVLFPQALHFGDSLFGSSAQPIGECRVLLPLFLKGGETENAVHLSTNVSRGL